MIKEAGVALQTFYRYFASKDQLLLALIGDLINEHCAVLTGSARSLTHPTDRLEMYVRTTLAPLHDPAGSRRPSSSPQNTGVSIRRAQPRSGPPPNQ